MMEPICLRGMPLHELELEAHPDRQLGYDTACLLPAKVLGQVFKTRKYASHAGPVSCRERCWPSLEWRVRHQSRRARKLFQIVQGIDG